MSLISINQLTFYYDGSPDYIFEDLTVQIDTDWKLGLVARNGRGKTTFLKLLISSVKSRTSSSELNASKGDVRNKAVCNNEVERNALSTIGFKSAKADMGDKYEYRGSITSPVEFDYLPFEIKDISRMTLDLLEDIYPSCELWKICRELTLLRVETDVLYRPFDTLSNGERTKVMLAVLFSIEHKFLLIDEPTNHLDMEARKTVSEYLNRKKGFILVSHDRNFMDECVDHIMAFNRNSVEVCQGNFSTWWENRQRKDAWEKEENIRLKKDIARLNQSVAEKSKWADRVEATKIGSKSFKQGGRLGQQGDKIAGRDYIGEKSRRLQQRRKSLEMRMQREIEEKSGLLKDLEEVENLKLYPLLHEKKVLVKMEEVTPFFSEIGEEIPDKEHQQSRRKLGKINLQIENGDYVVLQGKNGSGKSSVIRAILKSCGYEENQELHYEGLITTAKGLVISYVAQDTCFLKGNLLDFAEESRLDRTLFLMLLRKLDFEREQFDKNMEDYSGGQKKKVLIAKSLCEKAHLYIWDEPLNFIDVFSRMQIEELLLQFRPTLLLVEHDRTFVDKLATKIIKCGK